VSLDLPVVRGHFTRAGVINLYEYANEVFVFEDGNVVYKGANGTGKSRAMELTFPLLLEGSLAEHRVDTTGKQGRSFAWNLSLDGVYSRRIGYAWLEARMPYGDDGDMRWVTIGLGASGGQTGAAAPKTDGSWFFVMTDRRIRDPLRGVGEVDLAPDGQALTRKALPAALGDGARVFDQAVDYRRAVNDALFGFASMETYQAMVNLLFTLRRPKLTEVLSPDEFDRQLTASLPELDLTLVKDGAERLDKLERMRGRIEALQLDVAAAGTFSEIYRRYAARLAGERAGELLGAHRELGAATKAVADVDAEQGGLRVDAQRHAAARATAVAADARLQGRVEALRLELDSPGARRLDEAERAARDQGRAVAELKDSHAESGARLQRAQTRRETLSEQGAGALARLSEARDGLGRLAAACGVALDELSDDVERLSAQCAVVQDAVAGRRQLVRRAAELEERALAADARVGEATAELGAQRDALDAAEHDRERESAASSEADDRLREAVARWVTTLDELVVPEDAVTGLLAGLDAEPWGLRTRIADTAKLAHDTVVTRLRIGVAAAAAWMIGLQARRRAPALER
jgi:hypothetical protein